MRGVRGAEGEVQEERPLRNQRMMVPDHGDRLIDEIFGEVVPVFGARRLVDQVIVGVELGVEVVGLALHEAVEAVEPSLHGPVAEWSGADASRIGRDATCQRRTWPSQPVEYFGDRGGRRAIRPACWGSRCRSWIRPAYRRRDGCGRSGDTPGKASRARLCGNCCSAARELRADRSSGCRSVTRNSRDEQSRCRRAAPRSRWERWRAGRRVRATMVSSRRPRGR